MYTMKDACEAVQMPYETLKFYCNEGLVPNVKRNRQNYRVFDDRDIAWIKSLSHLKKCGMSIAEMKVYVELCLEGESSIPERKSILAESREVLKLQMQELRDSIEYIDSKQAFYDGVLSGEIPYISNLLETVTKDSV